MNPTTPAATTAFAHWGDRVRVSIAALAAAAIAMAIAMPADIAGDLGRNWTAPTTAASVVDVDAGLVEALADGGSATAIIRTVEGAQAGVVGAVETAGGELITPLPLVDGFLARVDTAVVDALRALGGAAVSISLDRPVKLHHTAPAGQSYDDDFYTDTIGARQLHAAGINGTGVGIALIDTGVADVAELAGRVTHAIDISGEGDGHDRFGHGTFTAGVAAGTTYGVAPGARLVSIKIAGEDGASDVSQVLAAIQYAVIHKDALGIHVLNLPIGTDSAQSAVADPLNFAVQQAWAAGIVVVVAAGNEGPSSGTIMKPADDPWVITVGASDSESTAARDDDTVPGFSSRGPTRTDQVSKPDLVAPGAHLWGLRAPGSTVDILAPEGRVGEQFFRGSGTSFSAAVVSGAVALMLQANPSWTPNEVKGALLSTTANGPVGDRYVDGHGAVDVATATTLAEPPAANQFLTRGTGDGGVAKSRGKSSVAANDAVLDHRSNLTAQGKVFDSAAFAGTTWRGMSWSQTQWHGTTWRGTTWRGTTWRGTDWTGTAWRGTTWRGTTWR